MNFIDSWVWLEYFLKGENCKTARQTIESYKTQKILIDTVVLTEVKYRITKETALDNAAEAIRLMESIENLIIVPVSAEIAKYASDLKIKYYKKAERAISLADAIHLATAILTNCDALYSGDPDFRNIEEIKTVVI